MPFKKGEGGRPPGAKNKSTREMVEWWREFTSSPKYLASASRRITDGKAPHLETFWVNKIHGKPTEHIEHSGALTHQMQVVFELRPST